MNSTPIQNCTVLTDSELRGLLLQYRRENWHGIQQPQWQERIVDDILRDDGEAVLQAVAGFWQIPSRARVLDIGSGVGSFVVACRRRGLLAFGVEPDRIGRGGPLSSIQIASRRVSDQVFSVAVGESLPFADQSFDLVTMNQVMEHVSDQAAALREAARTLKNGGALYVACPNYLRFYESHYKIFWIPLLPKWLGRWYLKGRGRNPVLLGQLNYTTNARLCALFKELGAEYAVIDIHREQFLEKCAQISFASRRARLIGRVTRLPGLGRLILRAALLFLCVTEGCCQMLILRRPSPLDGPC